MKKETRGISKFSSFEETRVKNILSLRGVRKKYLIVVCLVKTNGPAIILFLFLSLSLSNSSFYILLLTKTIVTSMTFDTRHFISLF